MIKADLKAESLCSETGASILPTPFKTMDRAKGSAEVHTTQMSQKLRQKN